MTWRRQLAVAAVTQPGTDGVSPGSAACTLNVNLQEGNMHINTGKQSSGHNIVSSWPSCVSVVLELLSSVVCVRHGRLKGGQGGK